MWKTELERLKKEDKEKKRKQQYEKKKFTKYQERSRALRGKDTTNPQHTVIQGAVAERVCLWLCRRHGSAWVRCAVPAAGFERAQAQLRKGDPAGIQARGASEQAHTRTRARALSPSLPLALSPSLSPSLPLSLALPLSRSPSLS